ncbi:MAG: hypothetical protein ACJA07_000046 [Rhodococcus sp. (in: high G+C Gram-positive bacteria)]|jgi:hypothetical protein
MLRRQYPGRRPSKAFDRIATAAAGSTCTRRCRDENEVGELGRVYVTESA